MITPKIKIKSGFIFRDLLVNYQIGFQSTMIRRSVLEKEELSFLPNFTNFPDYDLFMKIASKYEIGVIKEVLVKHRITNNSLTSNGYGRVSIEQKMTLSSIFINNPELKEKYKNEIKKTYDKCEYYDSINFVSLNNYKKAKEILRGIIFKDIKYFVLYSLILLNIRKYWILRILRRTS